MRFLAVIVVIALLLLLTMLALVGGLQNVSSKDHLSEAEAKTLIAKASSLSLEEAKKLMTTNPPGKVKNQSLSVVLLHVDPIRAAEENPKAAKEFRYLTEGYPRPADLAEAMEKSRWKGYVTLVQQGYITDCNVKAKDGVAEGTFSFQADGLYAGSAEFTAKYQDDEWKIVEFRLPNYGIKTVFSEDGLWQQSPIKPERQEKQEEESEPDSSPKESDASPEEANSAPQGSAEQ